MRFFGTRARASRSRVRLTSTIAVAALVVAPAAVLTAPAAAATSTGVQASINLTKTVSSTKVTPRLSLAAVRVAATAIPGDRLVYATTVYNDGSDMSVAGTFRAANGQDAAATVSAWWDDIEYQSTTTGNWTVLGGFAAAATGYTFVVTPPSTTGLSVTAHGSAASGVTYPSSGDGIVGTKLATGATGTWSYTGQLHLTAPQVATLSNASNVSGIRNVVHFEATPRSASAGQPFTYRTNFTNPFRTSSTAATDVSVRFVPSFAAPVTIDKSTVAALASVASGASVPVSATITVPAVAAKGSSESDSDYLSRLTSVDGTALTATVTASGRYGTTTITGSSPSPVTTTEHLPVVSIVKTGPAKADAGTTQTYSLAIANAGGAPAGPLTVTDALPDGSTATVTGVPSTLAAGAHATASASYAIPVAQPDGPLTDTATVDWHDANGNDYGPVASGFSTQVQSSYAGATLTLAPAMAGPNPVGSTQALTATLLDKNGNPLAGKSLAFAVSGANAQSSTATTDASGVAAFSYKGAADGADVVQVTFTQNAFVLPSNTASVSWVTPVASVGSTPVAGNFYAEPTTATSFVATPGSTPAFGQTFPTIDFNPPAGTVNHNVSGVGPSTRPFTDVTTDAMSNYNGTIVAAGNGVQAGAGPLSGFDAVFTANFVVAKAGDVTFNIISDDGFLLGVGGGASRVNGAYENAPTSNTSPFHGYPLVGAYNLPGGAHPATHPVTIHFPAPGNYPYELDYFEAGGGDLSLTMTVATFTAQSSPLSVYVGYADGLRPAGSIFPFPWLGSPGVNFEGCQPGCGFDGGAIRLDNSGTTPISVDTLTADFATCHFDIWPHGLTLPPGQIMIFAQTANGASSGCDNRSGQFDTSDIPYAAYCGQSGIIPAVNVTTDGVIQTFKDTAQILNTGGQDAASCGGGNESRSWQRIGGGGLAINVPMPPAVTLQLTPASVSGAIVGRSQRLTVTALDGSGNAVPSLPVDLSVFGANTQHLTATTDANGVAAVSYTGAADGTDVVTATALISGLREVSNQADIAWVIPTPVPAPTQTSSGTGTPTVTAQAPAPGTVVTGPVAVTADLTPPTGGSIASWSVTLQSTTTGTTTLASGSGTPPTPLTTLDPASYPSGTYTLTISATTTAGGTTTVSGGVVLDDGGTSIGAGGGGTVAQTPPAIGVPSPADGTVVTTPVPVKASITPPDGQTIASWQVTYQGAHAASPTTLASGTGTPPANLATFDPTAVPNDTYTLTVTGVASGGGVQSVSSSVTVTGNLKLGREVQTFDDLDVPVSGYQMRLHRIYDSTDKSIGDFGVGWHVSLSNFRESANGPLGLGGWSEYPTSCFFGLCNYGLATSAPHYVTVTFPDNHQEVFDFTPTGGSVLFYWQGSAAFSPRKGTNTTSTLTVDGDPSLTYGFDGNLYDDNFDPYSPTRFDLTTRDGQRFVLDVNTGLIAESDRNGNSLSVDAAGVHSSSGQSLTFTRDSAGRITDVNGPTGQHLTYDYTAGNLAHYTDADRNTFAYTYDADHNLLTTTGPGQAHPLQQLIYDSSGRISKVIDGAGNVTLITGDVNTRTETVADPNGKLTTVNTFDDRGNLIKQGQVFGGRTLTTSYSYDALGRQLSKTDPLGDTASSTYDDNGDLVTSTDATGVTLKYSYDTYGQLVGVAGPDGSTLLTLTHDSHGNLLSSVRGDGTGYSYTYNGGGQVTSITDPSGRTEKLSYDAAGHLTQVTDPSGHVTGLAFDGAGHLIHQTDPGGHTTSYTYDNNGHLTALTDGNGATTSFTYDAFGHQLTAVDPLGHTTSYAYDGAGRRTSKTDRLGTTTTYSYDADGKLVNAALPGGDAIAVSYDPLERPLEVADSAATVDSTYDDGNRVVSTKSSGPGLPTVTLGYSYDARGDRTSMTGPGGTTSYTYDPLQRLSSVTDPSGGAFDFTYNGHSTLAGLTRPNGVDDTLTDSGNDLLSRASTLGSTTLSASSYTYNANGLRASATDANGTTTYAYDAMGQLTSITPPSGAPTTYSYDGAGNRGDGTAYDGAERLTSDATASYTYNLEGELTSRTITATGATTTYTWNSLHQLTSITLPDSSVQRYTYDPLGRRVAISHGASTTAYVYDGSNIHLEYDNGASTPTAVYTDGLATDQVLEMARGGHRYSYLVDGLGSTVALTDETGAVVERYAYDAFGNQTSTGSVANPFTYTGREYDAATGLYYYRSRYYDPSTGRFLSEDPVLHPNAYPYVNNDPVNAVDPSGAQELEEEEIAMEVDATLAEAELSSQAQLVQDLAQNAANQGKDFLLQFLSEGEAQALEDMPYLARAFLGTAIHRAVAAALEDLGAEFVYNLVGPDFAFGDILVELTTEGAVDAHLARGGLYLVAEIVTYVLAL